MNLAVNIVFYGNKMGRPGFVSGADIIVFYMVSING